MQFSKLNIIFLNDFYVAEKAMKVNYINRKLNMRKMIGDKLDQELHVLRECLVQKLDSAASRKQMF